MRALTLSLADAFANLYKSCDKGKDKYLNFQLEWHRYCSAYLLAKTYQMLAMTFRITLILPGYSRDGSGFVKEKQLVMTSDAR